MNEAQKIVENLTYTWSGFLIYYLLPYRKNVMKKNIDVVYQQSLLPHQKKRLMLSFYSHFASSLKEIMLVHFKGITPLIPRVKIQGIEHILQARKKGKGVLILTSHLGNFDFAPYVTPTIMKPLGGDCYVVRKRIDNAFLENILFRNCRKAGFHIIQSKGAIRGTLRALAKNDLVYLAMDQHAPVEKKIGIVATFFGKKAGTHRSLATLAMRTGAPVVPMMTYRLKNGQHVVEYQAELPWIETLGTSEDAICTNTLSYNQTLEKFILAHPDQWLWSHRRWKLKS